MSLPDLPPELKLNIVEYLDPEAAFHFALTCKRHSSLCNDLLQEHARLFAKYSIVKPTNNGTLVWDFTKEVLRDPRKGWYVRELNLITDRPDTHGSMPEKDENLYRAAAEEILPLYPYGPTFFAAEPDDNSRELDRDMDECIVNHFEDPILVILIHHLPRLRTFRMTDIIRGDCLLRFMRRVAAGYQNPALAPQMPLQYLKTAAIAHYDTESSCSVDWAIYFLCVPSLRTFAAFMMGSEHVEDDDGDMNSEAYLYNTADVPVSNVEELVFHNCQFDPKTLDLILPMIKNLKRVEYQAGGHAVAYQDYEPRKVIKALATHVGHSLEDLYLAESITGFEEGENDIAFVSARDFKKLKALHCEARWLLRSPNNDLDDDDEASEGIHANDDLGEDLIDPRDNLPESLEYLYLHGVYEDEEWEKMVKIFGSKNACTPKLTLDTMCISRFISAWNGEEEGSKYGRAVERQLGFDNPLLTDIWRGHNHYL